MKKRLLAMALIAALSATAFTGCAGNGKNNANENGTTSYTMFAHNWHTYDGAEEDSIIKKLEADFGVDLNLIGAPSEGWIDKLSLKINANEVPDMFFFLPSNPQYRTWVELGIIQPLDDLIADTTYIKEIIEHPNYKNTTINGKHYFIPLISVQNSHAMYYRKDWLDKLGMSEPKTLDEYTEMLRAFTEDDPDGNGVDDTYGVSLSKVSGWLSSLYATFGVKPNWNKNGDKYEAYYMTDGYKDMLTWLADIYAKGYVQKEYFLDTDQQKLENFYSGKAGSTFANSGSSVDKIVTSVETANPNAEVDVLMPPSNGDNKGGMVAYGGFYGGWSFSSAMENPEKAIKMLDFLYSPEGQKLRVYGIEGTHHTVTDGKYEFIAENCIAEPNEVFKSTDGKVTSFYKIGDYFSSCFFEFDGDKIINSRDYSFTQHPDVAAKCDEIANANLNTSDIINILDFSEEYTDINSKLTDIAEKYLIMIVSGQMSADDGITQMKKELEEADYARAQELVKETVESF